MTKPRWWGLCAVLLAACPAAPPVAGDGGTGGGAAGGAGGGSAALVCDAGLTDCGGSCTDTARADSSCGACGHACTATQGCAGGNCLSLDCSQAPCADWQICFNELCVDRACIGVVCPPGLRCARGLCLSTSCGAMTCGADQACQNNQCVEAACAGVICPASERCERGICAALTCGDGVKNGTETATDCGGTCPPCPLGEACLTATDCASDLCSANVCAAAASCANGVRDGNERDVDCGGPACLPCPAGKCGCASDPDCASTRCIAGCCVPPSCADGLPNGYETGVDCGGDGGCAGCAPGGGCRLGADCTSNVCGDAGSCLAPTCSDSTRNGSETDVDCGGDAGCAPCGASRFCTNPSDCASRSCTLMRCDPLTCGDSTRNGAETDVDCGGPCPACVVGKTCLVPEDCTSNVCVTGSCRAPTCNDGIRNGTEAGPDCGGSCAPCGFSPSVAYPSANGASCSAAGDLDRDGKMDMVVGHLYAAAPLEFFKGRGDGTFAAAVSSPIALECDQLRLVDVNHDTFLDAVVLAPNAAAVALGDGAGNFGGAAVLPQAGQPLRSLAVADLDGDGNVDLLLGQTSGFIVLGGTGTGAFIPRTFVPVSTGALVDTADFNRDGRLDVLTAGLSGSVTIAWAETDGGFRLGTTSVTMQQSTTVYAGEVTGDGNPDFVLGAVDNTLYVYVGAGDGGFSQQPGLPGSASSTCPIGAITAARIDKDTRVDLVSVGGAVNTSCGNVMGVNLSNGFGVFQQVLRYPTAAANRFCSSAVGVADFNGDGKNDVAMHNGCSDTLQVWLNTW